MQDQNTVLPTPDHDGSLYRHGLVEIDLGDGTKCQMTVEQAKMELAKQTNIKEVLEANGITDLAPDVPAESEAPVASDTTTPTGGTE